MGEIPQHLFVPRNQMRIEAYDIYSATFVELLL